MKVCRAKSAATMDDMLAAAQNIAGQSSAMPSGYGAEIVIEDDQVSVVDAESNGQAKRRRCGSATPAAEIAELSQQLRRVAEQWAGNEGGVFIYQGRTFVLPTADKTNHLSANELRVQIARFEQAIEQDRSP